MSTQITGVTPGSQVQPTNECATSTSESKSDAIGGQDSEAAAAENEVKAVEQPTTVEVQSDSAHRDNEALGRHVDTFV